MHYCHVIDFLAHRDEEEAYAIPPASASGHVKVFVAGSVSKLLQVLTSPN